jgi:hypothetical protein
MGLVMMSIHDDPREGRVTTVMEDFRQGEPDPAIFLPPEGYEILHMP